MPGTLRYIFNHLHKQTSKRPKSHDHNNNADLKSIGRYWSRWIKNFKEESGLKARGQIALLRIFKHLDIISVMYLFGVI